MPAAVSHGSLSVTITERARRQPAATNSAAAKPWSCRRARFRSTQTAGAHVRVRRRRRSQRHRARGEPGGRRARRPRRHSRSTQGSPARCAPSSSSSRRHGLRIDPQLPGITRASAPQPASTRRFQAVRGDAPRRAADDPEALREAARQFESLFTKMMLESMREASFGDPMFGSDQGDMYQDMFDDQLAVAAVARARAWDSPTCSIRQLSGGGASRTPRQQSGVRTRAVPARRSEAARRIHLTRLLPHADGRGARARRRSAQPHRAGGARNRLGHVRSPDAAAQSQPVRHQGRRQLERRERQVEHQEFVSGVAAHRVARLPRLRIVAESVEDYVRADPRQPALRGRAEHGQRRRAPSRLRCSAAVTPPIRNMPASSSRSPRRLGNSLPPIAVQVGSAEPIPSQDPLRMSNG